jgi:hypothetical protein
MMVIEGADRFGLAQLHQLRGRVGRGLVESFCVLVTDSTDEVATARLRAVVESNDGFELAEKDFELRKEGDVLGLAQSGFPRLRVASLQVAAHRELAVRARAMPRRCSTRTADGAAAAGPSAELEPAGSGGSLPANRRAALTLGRTSWLTPAGSSPGRRAGSGSTRRRRHAAAGRPVKQTLFAILEPDLPAPRARPVRRRRRGRASRRCRAAPRTPPSSSATAAPRSSPRTSRDALGGERPRSSRRGDRWLGGPDAADGRPFDIAIVDPPYAEPSCSPRARGARHRSWRPARGSWPSTSGATRRRPGRAASIGARAPLRRDDADVLPAREDR